MNLSSGLSGWLLIEIKDAKALKLGSNVVALGGKEEGNVVSTGIITEFTPLPNASATSTDAFATDMNLSSGLSGWLLFDTAGNLSGFEAGLGEDKVARFINAGLLRSALGSYL
jgi:S1-C subfamily serine protease